ncbi:MAG: hypothetical protein RLZZ527_718, partial [Actinomycetota bacterium]
MNLALALVSYGITVVAVALFASRSLELYRRVRAGQPDPTRGSDRPLRLRVTIKEVLGHTKMLNFTASGIAHWFVMIGFVSLAGTLVTAYGQVLYPEFHLPLIGLWTPYNLFVEAIAWLTGISIVTLILIRQVTRFVRSGRGSRFFGSYSKRAYFVEAVILAIVFCVISLRGLEGALLGYDGSSWDFALSRPAVTAFDGLSDESLKNWISIVAALKIVISMTWFIVVAANLRMGVAWHRFLAPFNIFFKRNIEGPTLGALPEMISHGK